MAKWSPSERRLRCRHADHRAPLHRQHQHRGCDHRPRMIRTTASGLGPTVWYQFTPSEDMRIFANTAGSNYDTDLAVYTGTRGSLTQLACNDDAGFTVQSALTLDVTAGQTLYFLVGAFGGGSGGNLVFNVDVAPPPLKASITIGRFSSVIFEDRHRHCSRDRHLLSTDQRPAQWLAAAADREGVRGWQLVRFRPVRRRNRLGSGGGRAERPHHGRPGSGLGFRGVRQSDDRRVRVHGRERHDAAEGSQVGNRARWRGRSAARSLHSLYHHRDPLAQADAHRRAAVAATGAAEHVDQGREDPGPAGAC
jgi:hypothetical protein